MHTARVDHSQEIDAQEFSRLPAERQRELKGRLTCPDHSCEAPAHFRRRSRDGKPSLFYSPSHTKDCSQRSPWHETSAEEGDPIEEEAVWNDATELVLRFDPVNPSHVTIVDSDDADAPIRGHRHQPAHGERTTHSASIGLRPLLRRLRDDSVFRLSDRTITLSDGTSGTIGELCVHASDVTAQLRGRHVMWGPIARSRGNWIDSAAKEDLQLGVRIPDRILDQSLSNNGMERSADLASGEASYDFIVEGVVHEASSTAPYVPLENPDHLAILHRP